MFSVVTMNMRDGSVTGHAAGCADLKRGDKFSEPFAPWMVQQFATKHEVWLDYNGDFIAECDSEWCPNHDEAAEVCANTYSIDWKPCAAHVPE